MADYFHEDSHSPPKSRIWHAKIMGRRIPDIPSVNCFHQLFLPTGVSHPLIDRLGYYT